MQKYGIESICLVSIPRIKRPILSFRIQNMVSVKMVISSTILIRFDLHLYTTFADKLVTLQYK